MPVVPLLAFLFAFADTEPRAAPTCNVVRAMPASGNDDMPVNVVPALVVGGDGCFEARWHVTLRAEGEDEAAVDLTHDIEEDGPLIELFPEAELLPKTAYVIDALAESSGAESSQVGFHTWTDHVGDASANPEISELEASWTDGVLTVSSLVLAAEDVDANVTTLQREGRTLAAAITNGSANVLVAGSVREGSAPEELCVIAHRRGYAGAWLESEEACVAVVEEVACGCASNNGGGEGVVAAVVALFGVCRRKPARCVPKPT